MVSQLTTNDLSSWSPRLNSAYLALPLTGNPEVIGQRHSAGGWTGPAAQWQAFSCVPPCARRLACCLKSPAPNPRSLGAGALVGLVAASVNRERGISLAQSEAPGAISNAERETENVMRESRPQPPPGGGDW